MVNGVVVISSTFVAVFVIFVYLCEFMDLRSCCDCVGPRFASRLFFDDPCKNFCNSYLVMIDIRYCDARRGLDMMLEEKHKI